MLVVRGGPGTGKTVVALHRAAYLLYTHREQLARRGVLVVGPNPTFLRYIEQVLIVDPGAIVAESPRGLSDLYVAVTRATRRLGVIAVGALPRVLRRLPDGSAAAPDQVR